MGYDNRTVLMLPLGGANGDSLLADYSPARREVSVERGAPFLSESHTLGYAKSGYFGSGDAPQIEIPGLDLTGAFTLEAWVYLPAASSAGDYNTMCSFMTFGSNNDRLQWYVANDTVRLWTDGGPGHLVDNTQTPYTGKSNKWTHIVTQRNPDTSIDVFLDGELLHTQPSSLAPNFSPRAILNYARASSAHQYSDGMWMQDLKVTVGAALYDRATGFTPPQRLLGSYQGTVVDAQGAFAQREVRSYVRDTGFLFDRVVSEPDGTFKVLAYAGAQGYAVALPESEEENALIFDHLDAVGP